MSMMDASRNATSRLGAMGVAPEETFQQHAGKQTMAAVHYGIAHDPAMSCGQCVNYDGARGCALVAGTIRPQDTCDLFTPVQQGPDAMAAAPAPDMPPAAPAVTQ